MKVISYGKKDGKLTAQVVFNGKGFSRTLHLHQSKGKTFTDNYGHNYEVPLP